MIKEIKAYAANVRARKKSRRAIKRKKLSIFQIIQVCFKTYRIMQHITISFDEMQYFKR